MLDVFAKSTSEPIQDHCEASLLHQTVTNSTIQFSNRSNPTPSCWIARVLLALGLGYCLRPEPVSAAPMELVANGTIEQGLEAWDLLNTQGQMTVAPVAAAFDGRDAVRVTGRQRLPPGHSSRLLAPLPRPGRAMAG